MPILLLLLLVGGGAAWLLTHHRPAATSFVLLGDSLAVGLTPYLMRWAASKGLRFAQDAQVGRRTRAQGTALVGPGSLVFVSLGTNDAIAPTDGSQIRMLADEIRRRGSSRIVWLVPPATKQLPGIKLVRGAIYSSGVEAVTTAAPLRPDGLHPASYAVAFQDIARFL